MIKYMEENNNLLQYIDIDTSNIYKIKIDDEEKPTYYYYIYFIDNLDEEEKIKIYDKILATIGFLDAELRTDCIYIHLDKGK